MYGQVSLLTEEDLKKQEGDYIYRYRYNGGGATQVWLSSGRYTIVFCKVFKFTLVVFLCSLCEYIRFITSHRLCILLVFNVGNACE